MSSKKNAAKGKAKPSSKNEKRTAKPADVRAKAVKDTKKPPVVAAKKPTTASKPGPTKTAKPAPAKPAAPVAAKPAKPHKTVEKAAKGQKADAGGLDFIVPDTTRSRPSRKKAEARRSSSSQPAQKRAAPVAAATPVDGDGGAPGTSRAPQRPIGDRKEFKRLLMKGKERGFVTHDEVNEALPPDVTLAGPIEDAIALLTESEVEIVDDAVRMASDATGGDKSSTLVESTDTPEDYDYAEFSKGNDPVRMYLRKMGSVSLLTRDG
jgi:RNA polymerase primary sigma factor